MLGIVKVMVIRAQVANPLDVASGEEGQAMTASFEYLKYVCVPEAKAT